MRAIIAGVFDALQPTTVTTDVDALRADLRTLDRKIANLTTAIEDGAAIPAIITQLQTRQTERDALLATIGAAEAVGQLRVDRLTVERTVLAQVATWRALLTTSVADGRQLLREVLSGPLRFAPEGQRYRFDGDVATGPLIAGLVGIPPCVASPSIPSWNQIQSFLNQMGKLREITGSAA